MRQAEEGVETLQKMVDTLIIIPNQNLFRLANEKTTFTEAFSMADDVLYQGVKGVTDLMVKPGLINLDFADVRSVMDEMGKAMMGTGEASGEDRAIQAAEKAIANPLLDEISLNGAKGVLINITGGHDLTLFELDEAANRIREEVDPDANIIVGSTLDTDMDGQMRVSVVATGIDASEVVSDIPVPRRSMAAPLTQTVTAEAKPAEPVAAAPAAPVEEPSLFASIEAPAEPEAPVAAAPAAPTAPVEEVYEEDYASSDDLPPPAYRPQASEFRPQPDVTEEAPASFVAPKAPAAGTPSPEALARLQAAVQKAPSNPAPRTPVVDTQEPAPAPAPAPEADRSRFGINSLINRMTGHGHDNAPQAAARQHPEMKAPEPEQAADPDQERIEIPAFLRRQAN
jgi:cell division protein FtsZ